MADKKVSSANLAAKVTAGYLEKLDSNSSLSMFTYTTEQPHNFFVGAQVVVSGLATTTSGVTTVSITNGAGELSSNTGSSVSTGRTVYTATNSLSVGQSIYISGATTGFNGTFKIVERTATSFTVYNNTSATWTGSVTATAVVDLNVNNVNICKIDSPTEFSVLAPYNVVFETAKVLSGPATAQLINGSLASVKVQYAQPTS